MEKATHFDISEELKKLPDKPGVYLMHDEKDTIIYVGKAVSLKNRVRSYFREKINRGPKIDKMVSLINRFEYIVTDSELEALVLENNLIKEHRPKYNTMLMDDKTYPYIKVHTNGFPFTHFSTPNSRPFFLSTTKSIAKGNAQSTTQKKGYKNIAVTILPSPMIEEIRNYFKSTEIKKYTSNTILNFAVDKQTDDCKVPIYSNGIDNRYSSFVNNAFAGSTKIIKSVAQSYLNTNSITTKAFMKVFNSNYSNSIIGDVAQGFANYIQSQL